MMESLTSKILTVRKHIPFLPRALGIVWHAAPGYTVASVIILVAQGLLPVVTVTLTRSLINQITLIMGKYSSSGIDPAELSTLVLYASIMVGAMLFSQVLSGIKNWVKTNQEEKVGMEINAILQNRSNEVDYSFYETPADYDRLHRARMEATYRPLALVDNISNLIQSSITLIAMAGILLPYGWWLPPVLIASTLPALFIVIRNQRYQFAWQKRITPVERRTWYYEWIQSTRESAAELRLLGLGKYFQENYISLRKQLLTERRKFLVRIIFGQFTAALLGLIVAGLCLAWMGWRALNGLSSLGDLALFYQAFDQGQSLLRSLLEGAGQFYGNLLFLSNLFEYLDLPSKVIDPPQPKIIQDQKDGVSLKFEGVAFEYPGSKKRVFQNFNLEILAGQTVAILGDNGAGKSTLIKLICRLYDPVEGRITWDGTDVRSYSLADLRRRITVLFQEPMHYQETVQDNIGFGDWYHATEEGVHKAAQQAGAESFVTGLPQGYKSLLGNWFHDGIEISVGEWQKVALSRAFLREAPLLMLDEPTSAMDAWAEAEWLANARNWSKGRTTIIITHRLTTAMQANRILVMVGGKIVEEGSHQELLALKGKYAQAWKAQIQNNETQPENLI